MVSLGKMRSPVDCDRYRGKWEVPSATCPYHSIRAGMYLAKILVVHPVLHPARFPPFCPFFRGL